MSNLRLQVGQDPLKSLWWVVGGGEGGGGWLRVILVLSLSLKLNNIYFDETCPPKTDI